MHANICILRKYNILPSRAANLPPPAISPPSPPSPSLVQIPPFLNLPFSACLHFALSFTSPFLTHTSLSFLTSPYNFLPSPFSFSQGWHILTPSLWLSRHVKSCSQVLDALSGQKKILGKSVDRCNDYGSVWTNDISLYGPRWDLNCW